jgi:hypothetical protein
LSKNNNGELEVSVTHRESAGGQKVETLLKKEDIRMAEKDDGTIQTDSGEASEAQKELPENVATVSVGKKLTINLGNFESVSVSVHLSMPCVPEKEALNSMYAKVNKWVDARITEERNSVTEGRRLQG